ncbi:MAG: GerMN domain-containing protein, partial [Mycobacteriales bacterium]
MRKTFALLALLTLAACNNSTPDRSRVTPTDVASSTASSPTPSPSAPSERPAAGTMTTAVYYVRDDGGSARLYREFRQVPQSTGVVRAAVDAMLHLPALDPDYQSLWPRATRVRG